MSAQDSISNTQVKKQITFDSLKQALLKNVWTYGSSTATKITPRYVGMRYIASPVFEVQSNSGKYYYQFRSKDDSARILEFINEFFQDEKVEKIHILDSSNSVGVFGKLDDFGAIIMTVRPGADFNPKVAGLTTIHKLKRKYRKQHHTRYFGTNQPGDLEYFQFLFVGNKGT
ncbi:MULTISPECIES: hypothetical protein [unclassified Microcoleus]|uniref:hypothetical protein n=1 Tax=unclassified Microcoleus TaxID=2642155 RepID=UPI002FD105AF